MGTVMGTAWGLHGDCMGTVRHSPRATITDKIEAAVSVVNASCSYLSKIVAWGLHREPRIALHGIGRAPPPK